MSSINASDIEQLAIIEALIDSQAVRSKPGGSSFTAARFTWAGIFVNSSKQEYAFTIYTKTDDDLRPGWLYTINEHEIRNGKVVPTDKSVGGMLSLVKDSEVIATIRSFNVDRKGSVLVSDLWDLETGKHYSML